MHLSQAQQARLDLYVRRWQLLTSRRTSHTPQAEADAPLSQAQQARLGAVYEALAVEQRKAIHNLSRALRSLPASCYHPQVSVCFARHAAT